MKLKLFFKNFFVCSALTLAGIAVSAESLNIGSKDDTETQVLAEIYSYKLQENGISNKHKANLGGSFIPWQALKNDSIQIIPEYVGTIKEQLLHINGPCTKKELREALDAYGIEMTESIGFQNGYGLAFTRETAKKMGLA